MGRLIHQFLSHVVPNVARPLRVLWNEMIGFLFLVISVPFGWQAVKTFRKPDQDSTLLSALLSAGLAAMMMFFGIYSFLRARKIGRS